MSMPSFASSSQSDASVTRATLTPGTLILNKDSHPTVTDIKSLGINTELSLANQQVDKPNIDKLKENQEIAALTGQVGSFAVGELGQRMRLEEGSWQKAALHGAVGALSAQLSKGNVKAGAAAGAATEVINTQIANALATHTDLSPQARNNLQQVTAMVAGATAGNLVGNNTNSTVQGANTGLASEVFNRQLHPTELQQIHDHVKEFAKQQGITEEEAERQLTEETLRGASDDFANVKENRVARAYLNQLQRMEDGQHLFGVLDRNSSEYKNSLINAQYVTPNKDLYNRVNRDSKNYATTTADYVLNAAIREGKRNYQQAGKETVSQVYGNARAEANRYRDLERYHSEQESKQDQSLARKYSRQANSLTSAMAENYTSGTGLFSLKELYANKDPLAKTMLESIAESGYATGVGASLRAARNYSAKIPEGANANSKLLPVGEIKGYDLKSFNYEAHNLVNYERYKRQLMDENLKNIVELYPDLKHAALGEKNYTLEGKIFTKAQSDALGKIWVGEGYTTTSQGGFISEDGTRHYRPVSTKLNSPYTKTGLQSNFERFSKDPDTGKFKQESNLHLNIYEEKNR